MPRDDYQKDVYSFWEIIGEAEANRTPVQTRPMTSDERKEKKKSSFFFSCFFFLITEAM